MNITNRAVTISANSTTKQGYYEIEYLCEEANLKRMQVQLFTVPNEENPDRHHLGYVIMESGTMQCSLPEHLDFSPIFADFDNFVATIKLSLTEEE